MKKLLLVLGLILLSFNLNAGASIKTFVVMSDINSSAISDVVEDWLSKHGTIKILSTSYDATLVGDKVREVFHITYETVGDSIATDIFR